MVSSLPLVSLKEVKLSRLIWSCSMSLSFFSKIFWLPLVALMPVLTGCGVPKPDGFPKLYPVSLKFLQEGEPCGDTMVFLLPEDESKWSSGGVTNSEGVAVLRTHGKFVGVPAGKYKITVQKNAILSKGSQSSEIGAPTVFEIYDVINPDYGDRDKTPLEIEIGAGKKKFEPFELGKKVHIRTKN